MCFVTVHHWPNYTYAITVAYAATKLAAKFIHQDRLGPSASPQVVLITSDPDAAQVHWSRSLTQGMHNQPQVVHKSVKRLYAHRPII